MATELVQACAEAARRGGAVLRERFGQARTVERKGAIDLVTDADRASEAAVLEFLSARFPAAAILAEESGARAGEGGLRFVVDPLDGTTNYAHRFPHFAVNVAAMDPQGILAAATFDPVRGELFTAARGGGAFLDDAPLPAPSADALVDALLVTGFPYDVHQRHARVLRVFEALVTRAQGMRRTGSAALDLAYVAAGRFDGYFEASLKPWDIAPGILLCRELGLRVSDYSGGDRMLEVGEVVAAPPALHARMLEALRPVL
jgi:myo-inositol-1(or 4)-monophosphatase